MVDELFPPTCSSLILGTPLSLAGFAVPFAHVPLEIIWGVKVSATSVTFSPFLIVIEDWIKLLSFICTVFEELLSVPALLPHATTRRLTIADISSSINQLFVTRLLNMINSIYFYWLFPSS